MIARYGKDEVRQWYFEVWNEPNLAGFWEKADQAAYFDLYLLTAQTIKAIDPRSKVGGPPRRAAWVPELLAFVKQEGGTIDFVTTHTYGVNGGFLDERASTTPSSIPRPARSPPTCARAPADREFRLSGLPLYFTEWSTSYTPRDLVHDSYISAPYILAKLKSVQGAAQGMSYWVYSDLFEEPGPPTTEFHGGFGLMTKDGIRKPAWFAYKYLHALQGQCAFRRPASWIAARATRWRRWSGISSNRCNPPATAASMASWCPMPRPRRCAWRSATSRQAAIATPCAAPAIVPTMPIPPTSTWVRRKS
jgi:beta-xylosidase